jgi:hypothetical protein
MRGYMTNIIDYEQLDGNYILDDVRSSKEYLEFKITRAVNLTLLVTREIISTIYIYESIDKA